jgi:hypothetical protein
MNSKENFIKKLEAYFNSNFNDFTKKRLGRLLDEFIEESFDTTILKKIKKDNEKAKRIDYKNIK